MRDMTYGLAGRAAGKEDVERSHTSSSCSASLRLRREGSSASRRLAAVPEPLHDGSSSTPRTCTLDSAVNMHAGHRIRSPALFCTHQSTQSLAQCTVSKHLLFKAKEKCHSVSELEKVFDSSHNCYEILRLAWT